MQNWWHFSMGFVPKSWLISPNGMSHSWAPVFPALRPPVEFCTAVGPHWVGEQSQQCPAGRPVMERSGERGGCNYRGGCWRTAHADIFASRFPPLELGEVTSELCLMARFPLLSLTASEVPSCRPRKKVSQQQTATSIRLGTIRWNTSQLLLNDGATASGW